MTSETGLHRPISWWFGWALLIGWHCGGWLHFPALRAEEPRWVLGDTDCRFERLRHKRWDDPESMAREELKYRTGKGRIAHLVHDLGRLPVIAELAVEIPFRATQPGAQLWARVVLPRTRDEQSGEPLRLLLPGSSYDKPQSWQSLSLPPLESAVERQVYLLRNQPGRGPVDAREAYVEALVLNLYSGGGLAEAWIGEPTVEGAARGPLAAHRPPDPLAEADDTSRPDGGGLTGSAVSPWTVQGDLLLLRGQPAFVRAVEARGEPWQYLQRLGFNAVYIDHSPRPEECQLAEQLGIWIIAPPPGTWSGHAFPQVAAWDLTPVVSLAVPGGLAEMAASVRRQDPVSGRPLLGNADALATPAGRSLDILARTSRPLVWRLDPAEPGRWREDCTRRGEHLRPRWAMVPTEPPEEVQQQRRAFAAWGPALRETPPAMPESGVLEPFELHRWVFSAVTSGIRGLIFTSRQRLDENTDTARLRSTSLRLLNLQLETMAPWLAAGVAESSAQCNPPSYDAGVLRHERGSLVMALWQGETRALASSPSQESPLTVTVHGVPVASEAFVLGSAALSRTALRHEAGGCQFLLHGTPPWQAALISREPMVFNAMQRQLAQSGPLAAELTRQLADGLLVLTEATAAASCDRAGRSAAGPRVGLAAASLKRASACFERSDFVGMYRESEEALWNITCARAVLRTASSGPDRDGIHQACFDLTSFRKCLQMAERDAFGPNLLTAGDVEDLSAMREAGWHTFHDSHGGQAAAVRLLDRQPPEGDYHLRLELSPQAFHPTGPTAAPPRLWLVSPHATLPPHCAVCIEGWWRVVPAEENCAFEATIFDSWGGPALGLRTARTDEWQRFELLRATRESGQLGLTVGLTGAGRVDLDDIQVRVMEPWWRDRRVELGEPSQFSPVSHRLSRSVSPPGHIRRQVVPGRH